MKLLDADTRDLLWFDPDVRAVRLRGLVMERMAQAPPPRVDDHVVVSYFLALRNTSLDAAAKEIAYHATSGVKNPPPGSLLAQCTAHAAAVDPWDATGRMGLLHVAFPLKMLLQPDGHLTSCDLLHTVAGGDYLRRLRQPGRPARFARKFPTAYCGRFPGPRMDRYGLREATDFAADEPAFGTILKPTAGITPDEVGNLVAEAAQCPLFLFVKEDEDLYPNLGYSPVAERVRRAVEAIERSKAQRAGKGLIFAPHITGAPHEMLETLHAVLEAGATGVMFSETFAGGTRADGPRGDEAPAASAGHLRPQRRHRREDPRRHLARGDRSVGPAGRHRLPPDGPDPARNPLPSALRRRMGGVRTRSCRCQLPGIKPTMIVRAGGLDQGNIILNLMDAERRGHGANVLFLAGSAINSVKNAAGRPDPKLGTEAMLAGIGSPPLGRVGRTSPSTSTCPRWWPSRDARD